MQYFGLSNTTVTAVVLIGFLASIFIGAWIGIYKSKKRVKTSQPGKETEISD